MLSFLKKAMTNLVGNAAKCRVKTVIWTVKMSLVLIGIISTVLLAKIAIPYSLKLLYATVPSLWISIRSWLSPPYLYLLVNFIIIAIAASNCFQHKISENKKKNEDEEEEEIENAEEKIYQKKKKNEDREEEEVENFQKFGKNPSDSGKSIETEANSEHLTENEVDTETEAGQNLDDTWKAITEPRGVALTRQLKKSDTWKATRDGWETDPTAQRKMRKSETFNDGSSRVWREKSVGQDELNRRAEEFIEKFKLDRKESDRLYMEMVNRKSSLIYREKRGEINH